MNWYWIGVIGGVLLASFLIGIVFLAVILNSDSDRITTPPPHPRKVQK